MPPLGWFSWMVAAALLLISVIQPSRCLTVLMASTPPVSSLCLGFFAHFYECFFPWFVLLPPASCLHFIFNLLIAALDSVSEQIFAFTVHVHSDWSHCLIDEKSLLRGEALYFTLHLCCVPGILCFLNWPSSISTYRIRVSDIDQM